LTLEYDGKPFFVSLMILKELLISELRRVLEEEVIDELKGEAIDALKERLIQELDEEQLSQQHADLREEILRDYYEENYDEIKADIRQSMVQTVARVKELADKEITAVISQLRVRADNLIEIEFEKFKMELESRLRSAADSVQASFDRQIRALTTNTFRPMMAELLRDALRH
jgi:FKBP-type peptidyl-prolyl cis-trans isomerase (trigger factor)